MGGLDVLSIQLPNEYKKREVRRELLFLCHSVPNYRTFIDDYLKIVEFIEWLKEYYPEKATFLTEKSPALNDGA